MARIADADASEQLGDCGLCGGLRASHSACLDTSAVSTADAAWLADVEAEHPSPASSPTEVCTCPALQQH